MSIDKVEITNPQGNLLALTLEDISNGYVVEDIDGLGPVKATISSSSFAEMNGQQYQNSSREVRNIALKLGYAPNFSINQTVRALRSKLYQFFMTDIPVEMDFYMTDGLVVHVSGRVETCEPSIFTREPQMDISILVFDPDFVDVDVVTMHSTFTTIDNVGKTVNVIGSVETGLTSLTFTVPKVTSEFTIYHTTPSGNLRTMLVSAPFLVGDVIKICTIKGQKSITMTRGGITTSLMYAVSPQSVWVLLEPGVNYLYLNATTTGPSAPVLIDYHNRYGGL